VDSCGWRGQTALVYASKHGHAEVVHELLMRRADTNVITEDGFTPLMAAVKYGRVNVLDELKPNASITHRSKNTGVDALSLAAKFGHTPSVKWLLAAGASGNTIDKRGEMAIHKAAFFGNVEVLEALARAPGIDLNARTVSYNSTALMRAAQFGRTNATQVLLAAGAARDLRDREGNTAFLLAAQFGHGDCLRVLSRAGANITVRNDRGLTALMYASIAGRVGDVELLLELGAPVDARDIMERTAVMFAARFGRAEVLQQLLRAGADANLRDSRGRSPVLHAVRYGRGQATRVLVEHGADVDVLDDYGWSPLRVAEASGDIGSAAALLRKSPRDERALDVSFLMEARLELFADRPPPLVPSVEYDESWKCRGFRFCFQLGSELCRGIWKDTIEEVEEELRAIASARARGYTDERLRAVIDKLTGIERDTPPSSSIAPLNFLPKRNKRRDPYFEEGLHL